MPFVVQFASGPMPEDPVLEDPVLGGSEDFSFTLGVASFSGCLSHCHGAGDASAQWFCQRKCLDQHSR